jgi:hypothetical protein
MEAHSDNQDQRSARARSADLPTTAATVAE